MRCPVRVCLFAALAFPVVVACGDDGGDDTPITDVGDTATGDTTADVSPDTADVAPDTTVDASDGSGADTTADAATDTATDTADVEPDIPEDPPWDPASCTTVLEPSGGDDTEAVQTALILASSGDEICFAPGTFLFTTEVSLDVDGVTLRGGGMRTTTLDFSGQDVGANGISITSDDVTVQDLFVFDTPGDGIRAQDADGITFRRVKVSWAEAESQNSGAYALYPVGCTNVLVEGCDVSRSRDAGVYVGQSSNIIVRDNTVYGNVAGIEIENSTAAEVYDNHAFDNTAGILIFNLPKLAVYGSAAIVRDNLIENNNLENFGVDGTIVAVVPPGVGILVLACDDNEFYDNTIRGHRTVGFLGMTYLRGLFGTYDDAGFDEYAERNYIHDNLFENNGYDPVGSLHAVAPVLPKPGPDIIIDGCQRPADEGSGDPVETRYCFGGNGDADFINMDFCNSFENVETDLAAYTCEYPALPPITIE
jgi:parallel beta-helix repeat protein